ncbi:SAM-dependent methyltransferase [Salinibacter altiplanensis]|uniref:SAM-dependent methyltransferase n=1 Tax=Salinibacter altiplanensis TaxID=1803181 RepID=UPI000C9ED150|nr:class I SAM-dependent methyltransferase [Salinibacter altiplanensis]
MSWYEEWFWSDAYTRVYDHRDDTDAERLVDLIEQNLAPASGSHLLDIGCGRGRHARALARRDWQVTGLDLSEDAIAAARSQAADEGLDETVSFQVGDMRTPVCDGCADGVINLFTSFGYFDADAENERALAAMATALRPDGWFLQDFLNAPQVAASLGASEYETEDGHTIHQDRWIEDGRVNKQITVRRNGHTETFQESVRLYTLSDLTAMYARVGLDVVDLFGDYDGGNYVPDESPRLLLHAVPAS